MHNYDVCVSINRGRKEITRRVLAVSATSRFNAALAAEELASQSLDQDHYAHAILVKPVHEAEMAYAI